jgi:predicted  nucleic acid-binding Zn-ribbon protein
VEDNNLQEELAKKLEVLAGYQAEFDACSKALSDFEPTYQEIMDKATRADEALLDAQEKANRTCVRFNRDGLAYPEFRQPEAELAVAEYNAALFNSKLGAARLSAVGRTYRELEEKLDEARDELSYRTTVVDLCRARIAMQEVEAVRDASAEWIAVENAMEAWRSTETHDIFAALVDEIANLEYTLELRYEAMGW